MERWEGGGGDVEGAVNQATKEQPPEPLQKLAYHHAAEC